MVLEGEKDWFVTLPPACDSITQCVELVLLQDCKILRYRTVHYSSVSRCTVRVLISLSCRAVVEGFRKQPLSLSLLESS